MKERKLLKEGPGSFYVKWTKNTDKEGSNRLMSKSGFKMILVCCRASDSLGQEEDIYTYFTENGLMFVDKLLNCLGIPNNYTPEMTIEDPSILDGRAGDCILSTEESEQYGRSNKISTFIKKLNGSSIEKKDVQNFVPNVADDFSDEIPF